MKRFKNVLLVAHGGSGGEAPLKRAVSLAKRNRARLTVVEVIEELPRDIRRLMAAIPTQDLLELVIKERCEQLEQCIAPIRKEHAQVSAKVLIGTPFMEIIREVLRRNHDLVIMTAEGRGGPKKWLFGSTSMHLMRKCPCPVWVMKPSRRARYARILAAVDPDSSDDVKDALNAKILDLATSLAQLEQSELHVVHAWTLFGRTGKWIRSGIYACEVDKLARETRDEKRRQVDRLLDRCDLENLNRHVHLLRGEAEVLIPRMAQRKRVDLIVMGTVCRTGLSGFFIGNTAEKVLQQVDCSVLTVKPEGFVTPVSLESVRD